mgnify:CR=1 FL=1
MTIRNVLITGATSGIGLSLFERYAKNGDNVINSVSKDIIFTDKFMLIYKYIIINMNNCMNFKYSYYFCKIYNSFYKKRGRTRW